MIVFNFYLFCFDNSFPFIYESYKQLLKALKYILLHLFGIDVKTLIADF